jgi:hypothetical protein
MRGIPAILVALWIGLQPGMSAQVYANKNSQTLASVKLTPAVRKNIEQVIFDFVDVPDDQRKAKAAEIPFDRVMLGPRGRWVWQSMAPSDFCGSHAKCEYWLFDPTTGMSLVDDALGAELDVLDTRHNGWRDFATSGNISYCEDVTVYYQFDGHKYRNVRTNVDRSTCDPDGP